MPTCDVAILGAGPYGLSAGAHLRTVKGLDVRVFGEPMEFWKSHMPAGMFLRSPWTGSHISDPNARLTLDAFRVQNGNHIGEPIPLDRFVEYGLWFQRQAVPEVDRRRITRIGPDPAGFLLTLDDGEKLKSRRVVIAVGIGSFAYRPPQFAGLPSQFVSHSCDQRDVGRFKGNRVVVVGCGQSALESAALIRETGGDVEVIVRAPRVHWLGWRSRMQRLGPIARLLYSPADVGPAGISRIVAVPDLLKHLPRGLQDRFRVRSVRPAGARWLQNRCKDIPIIRGRSIVSAQLAGGKLHLRLDDGLSRDVDHVLLGTGYHVDVLRYPFLTPELSQAISRVNGFPRLTAGFESSVPGLYFLGAPAAWSFGPLMYFVVGTEYASPALARYITEARGKFAPYKALTGEE